jgi:hypothetical protein
MPPTTNLREEEIVDAPGNDGNALMLEQVKRTDPWMMMMMILLQQDKKNVVTVLYKATCQIDIQRSGNTAPHVLKLSLRWR